MGKHTQLDGAVISSKADTKNNQLDTGTLGFSDIHNYAEYKVEHQSGGVSTSGGVEGNMLANMGHALAMAGNHSDSTKTPPNLRYHKAHGQYVIATINSKISRN